MKEQQTAVPVEQTTKRRKKKRNSSKKPIPLIKGTTGASLAKKRQQESSSRSQRRKRRRDGESGSKGKVNNDQNSLFASTAESLAVISKFHTLNKRLEQTERDTNLTESERQDAIRKIRDEQEALGGLDRYQKASMYGAKSSKFVCADWVVPLLQRQRAQKKQNEKRIQEKSRRLRILDVGAIDNQYHGKGYDEWLDAIPIDLHGGQHESVLQIDFFDYAHDYCSGIDRYKVEKTDKTTIKSSNHKVTESKPTPRPFDAIVLSLVLNFQGDPRKRGDMLALASDPRLLTLDKEGMLFVALPSASLDNSRYCDLERFVEVVTNPLFGLELVEQKVSAKLVLLAFQRNAFYSREAKQTRVRKYCYDVDTETFDYGEHELKRLQPPKPGAKRNNFAVILKSSQNRT